MPGLFNAEDTRLYAIIHWFNNAELKVLGFMLWHSHASVENMEVKGPHYLSSFLAMLLLEISNRAKGEYLEKKTAERSQH